jgi:hypothetical protein
MREMTKILLSACAVCAFGQAPHTARADNNPPDQVPPPQVPPAADPSQTPPPIPTDTPSPGEPTDSPPVTPDNPNPSNPPNPTPDNPNPPNPANPPVTPPPAPTTTQTTTTTSTTTSTSSANEEYSYAWSDPALASGIGVSVILGGGATGFTERAMRNVTSNVGGLWDLRATIGSHLPLALDVSYVGSATSINGLPTGNSGTLIGTTAEGALRWNILPHFAWTPYVFGGAGWQRYDVTGTHLSLADTGMNNHDNLLEFPMGGGLAYRMNGFVFDLRGTFRYTTHEDLVLTTLPTTTRPITNDFARMHTWEASAALGYEF